MRVFNKEGLKGSILIALSLIFLALLLLFVVNVKKEKPSDPKVFAPPAASVLITPAGFVPASLTIMQGTKVTWTNQDDKLHQVAANPHPAGTDLPGLRSEILNRTQTYTYTANKTGSFGYHDQLNPSVNGTIDVKEKDE